MKIKVFIDTLTFLKLTKKVPFKVELNKDSVNKLFGIYKLFCETKKTKLDVTEKHLPSNGKTLIDEILKNKKKLIDCDPEFETLSCLNKKQEIYDWIVDNHTKVSFLDCLDLDRGDKLLNRLLYDNPFIPINVITSLEREELIYRKASLDGIDIHYFEKKDRVELDLEEIFRIAKMVRILTKKVNKRLTLVFAMTDFKKEIPNLDDTADFVFRPIHVNSGSSYRGKYINIWRREEVLKVLIHELIHYLEIDIKYVGDSKKIESYLKSKVDIKGACNPSEIYTESLAVIFHTIYICSKLQTTNFKKFLEKEIRFSLLQVAKILLITGSTASRPSIRQTTDVCGYFIFKTVVLLDLDRFISFLSSDFDFSSRTDQFVKILDSNFEKLKIVDLLDNIQDDKLVRSMRMTCIELKID